MRTSDFNIRKKILISNISKIEDEKILAKIELLLNGSSSFLQLTKDELIARAKKSLNDVSNGRVISQDVLEKESDLW